MDDLGRLVRVHRGQWSSTFVGVLSAYALTTFIWWARSAMDPKSYAIALLVAFGATAISIGLTVYAWHLGTTRISAFERGLTWGRGATPNVLRYDDIASVSELRLNGKRTAVIITRHDGREVRLPGAVTEVDLLLAQLARRPAGGGLPVAIVVKR